MTDGYHGCAELFVLIYDNLNSEYFCWIETEMFSCLGQFVCLLSMIKWANNDDNVEVEYQYLKKKPLQVDCESHKAVTWITLSIDFLEVKNMEMTIKRKFNIWGEYEITVFIVLFGIKHWSSIMAINESGHLHIIVSMEFAIGWIGKSSLFTPQFVIVILVVYCWHWVSWFKKRPQFRFNIQWTCRWLVQENWWTINRV